MIERYSLKEMSEVFSIQSRFNYMLKVEKAVAYVQGQLKIIPKRSAEKIQKAVFQIDKINEYEKITKHDVIAFTKSVADSIGADGAYLHFGMTSSDILDTALSLQIKDGFNILEKKLNQLDKVFLRIIKQSKGLICLGRTHGMMAEPTSYAIKFSGFYCEFKRNKKRIQEAVNQVLICKLSGAVGTYSGQSPKIEEKVAKYLRLSCETVATQVVPRDRYAQLFMSFACFAAGLDRLSIELRHLQRSEVSEVTEGFSKGQRGSSAMPHKKNPISAENISGLSRLLKSYVQPALDNVSLWHERDISHSSVERVILADAFILVDYLTDRLSQLLTHLQFDKTQIKKNLQRSQGRIFSSAVLNQLVLKGMPREKAYYLVQDLSHNLGEQENLYNKILSDNLTKKYFKKSDLDEIFSGRRHLQYEKYILSKSGVK